MSHEFLRLTRGSGTVIDTAGRNEMHAGDESAGGDHQQNSMGPLARLLGRQDVKMNGTIGVSSSATLSEHASTWMRDALRMSAEITLDQPNQGAAKIFARQLYTLLVHLCEGRALALVREAPDHNGLEAWRLLHE